MAGLAEASESPRSVTAELTVFIEEVMNNEDTVSVDKLVRMAHVHFNNDRWMLEALIREGLHALVPGIAQKCRQQRRQQAWEAAGSEQLRRERIIGVFEHVGMGFSKKIGKMVRPEHVFVAEHREMQAVAQAAPHLRWASFHRAVAEIHTDDLTPTSQLPVETVSQLWQEHIEQAEKPSLSELSRLWREKSNKNSLAELYRSQID
jgi:hypothetical protein